MAIYLTFALEGVEFQFFQVGTKGVLQTEDGWNVCEWETAPTTEELEMNAKKWIEQNSDKIGPPDGETPEE